MIDLRDEMDTIITYRYKKNQEMPGGKKIKGEFRENLGTKKRD